jgi:hypothetical protein
MKAAAFILLPNTTSSKALQNKVIGFYYLLKINAMLHLINVVSVIFLPSLYQIRNFTIAENVSLLPLKMNNYEASSNYSNVKKGQYRSKKEC